MPIRELCAASDSSRSSFYARFPNAESLVHLAYDRFSERALAVCDDIEARWPRVRPGGPDFEAYVRFLVREHLRFYDDERRLVQAFRSREATDPVLLRRREALDRSLIERALAVTQACYPAFPVARYRDLVERNGTILIATARSVFDFPDQLSVAKPEDGLALADQFAAMAIDFVRSGQSDGDGRATPPIRATRPTPRA